VEPHKKSRPTYPYKNAGKYYQIMKWTLAQFITKKAQKHARGGCSVLFLIKHQKIGGMMDF
jgi:hypothetical protein